MLFRLNTPHSTSSCDVGVGQREANMGSNKGWVGATCCFLLFTVVFLSQKMDVFSVTVTETGFRGEPGMLLFLLPGIVASGLSARGRLRYPFLGALMAMPLCLIILHFWRTPMNAIGLCDERRVLKFDGRVGVFVRLRLVPAVFSLKIKTPKAQGAPLVRMLSMRCRFIETGSLWHRLRNRCNRRCVFRPKRSAEPSQPAYPRF